jgi:hypothetical protein
MEKKEYPVKDMGPNIPKIFLEIEVSNLNLEGGEEVSAFFGMGQNFDSFGKEDGGKIVDWKQIETVENGQVFQAEPKRENERKCHFAPETVDPNSCDKRYPHCGLSCRTLKPDSPGCIRLQANRKYVAESYDDGERAWNMQTAAQNKTGKWPEGVKIGQFSKPWPTEEILAQILFYLEGQESMYNDEKKKEKIPIINKILILQKGSEIEYVVDRFVSV